MITFLNVNEIPVLELSNKIIYFLIQVGIIITIKSGSTASSTLFNISVKFITLIEISYKLSLIFIEKNMLALSKPII